MAQSNNTVKFAYIAIGSSLPVSRNADTIYFDANDQQLYVGSDLIANASALDVVITGAGDYVSDAVFSDGTLTLTKSTLPDVTGAMRFIGASSTEITDQGTELPTIGGETVTPVSGDVVIYNSLEFVWDGAKWIQLGDESSYALKTIQVTAGAGLSGGGTLSSNITLGHQPISSSATPDTTYSFEFAASGPITQFDVITKIDVDEFGHLISVVGSNVSNVLNSGIDAKVTAAVSGLASKGYVDSALSGLASEGYVDDAISSISKEFISHVSTSAVSDVKSTVGYVTSMVVDSGPTIAYSYASVGEVTSTDAHLVTGQAVYSAIESAISALPHNVIMRHTDSAHTQYLVGGLLSDGMVDLMYRNFGTVTSTSPDPVTGSIVYSAISELAPKEYVDSAISSLHTQSSGDYLTGVIIDDSGTTVNVASAGSVAEDDEHLVTGGTVYSAIQSAISDLASVGYVDNAVSGLASEGYVDDAIAGLSGAMKFIGISTTTITDGGTQTPTIDGESVTPSAGDVVIYDGLEFVWTGTAWAKFGDESSFALKTTQVSAGNGLTGGGNLTSNIELSHYDPATASSTESYNYSSPFNTVQQIIVDEFGHIVSIAGKDMEDSIESAISAAISSAIASAPFISSIDVRTDTEYGSNYLANIYAGEDAGELVAAYSDYGAVEESNSNLVTGGIVYDAISNLASKGYVDDALSNVLTSSDILISGGDSTETQFAYYASVNNGQLDLRMKTVASEVSSTGSIPVTGSAVYSAINSYIGAVMSSLPSSWVTTVDPMMSEGQYLYDITADSGANFALTPVYHSFGVVDLQNNDLVRGRTVYSAIQAAIPTWTVI